LARLFRPSVAAAGAAAAYLSLRQEQAHAQQLHRPLAGRNALVTGSTSGVGLSVAEALASAGCNVALNGFGSPSEIQALERELIHKYQVKVTYVSADLSKPEECRQVVANAEAQMGAPMDILINNAGIQHVSPLATFPEERWDAVLAINLSATFHTSKACLPKMVERGYGRIINIASAHGKVASANKGAYVASKHGVVGLTKVAALETAGTGVTVNAICPGWLLTPLVVKQIEARAAASGRSFADEKKALVSEKMPSGEAVLPEHIGQLVVFLCSEAGQQITGSDLSVDGGWTAQ